MKKKDNSLSYNSLNINIVVFHHEKNNERLKYKKITILIKIKYICLWNVDSIKLLQKIK